MPKKDLRPPTCDFEVMQGATITLDITLRVGGVLQNLNLWSGFKAAVRLNDGVTILSFTVTFVDALNGVLKLTMPAATALLIPSPDTVHWDFWGTDPTSVTLCLSRGLIHTTPRIVV